jgi:L-threonylcarbamoyladenylate synthase
MVQQVVRLAWAAEVDQRSSGHTFELADLVALHGSGAETLVSENEAGEIVGTVTLVPSSGNSSIVELTKLATHPSLSGKGVGTSLVDEAIQWTIQRGKQLLLAVSLYQPELVRFYARFGFVVDPEGVYEHASPTSPTPIVMTRPGPVRDVIGEATGQIRSGRLVAMPTETVYGLAADASDPIAVRGVFARKGRPVDHPLIVHIASDKQLDQWAVPTEEARLLAARFWPGPLTLVLPRQPHVLDEVTGGHDTVALRVPQHALALALISSLGPTAGLVAPSANRFGGVSPTSADHVRADGLADYVLDGGPCAVGIESTILELVDGRAQILRPGAITAEQIKAVIGRSVETVATGASRAPGMLASHYAPRAAVMIIQPGDPVPTGWATVGYFGPTLNQPTGTISVARPPEYTAASVAPVLYAALREADALGCDILLVVEPPDGDLGPAVRDRLNRAAAPRPDR